WHVEEKHFAEVTHAAGEFDLADVAAVGHAEAHLPGGLRQFLRIGAAQIDPDAGVLAQVHAEGTGLDHVSGTACAATMGCSARTSGASCVLPPRRHSTNSA